MRILHAISGLRVADGGPPRVAVGLGAELARLGHDVTLLATNGLPVEHEPLGIVETDRLTAVTLDAGQTLPALFEAAKPAYDIVQFHGVWHVTATRFASYLRRHGVPYLVMPHGMLDRWSMAQKRLKKQIYLALFERRMLNGAARIHALTEMERKVDGELGITAPHFVLPNGVDPEEFDNLPEPNSYRSTLDRPASPLLTYMARIHHKKGADLLVPAFCRVAADFPDALMVIAGPDYGLQEQLVSQAREAGCEDRILFPGMVTGDERLALLRDTDIFCLPSRQEGHPMSIVEATYVGAACLATDPCNVPELKECDGALFVDLTVDSIADGLRTLIADEARRAEIAANGQRYARGHYTWPSIANQLAEHYERILAERSGS